MKLHPWRAFTVLVTVSVTADPSGEVVSLPGNKFLSW
jgi:hypothetical protein